jgi:hypothetical protein
MATVADIITAAFRRLNVVESNAQPSPEDQADGFLRFKAMLGSWRLQRLTIPLVIRIAAPLVALKQTYTVGTGGDLAVSRPPQPASLRWTLRDSSVVPALETPLVTLTEEQQVAIAQKEAVGRPTQVLYVPHSGPSIGSAFLYPIPTSAPALSLVLYAPVGIADPLATSSTLIVPDGYDLALMDNLARVLWPEWRENVPIDPELRASAIEGLGWIKTNNVRQHDLGIDPTWIFQGHGSYDITTDQGS